VPGLDRDGAAGVLERAGSAGTGSLRQIAAYLAGHPDPLRIHRQDIPPGLIRLAWRLHADGHDWVIAPQRAGCGKITAALNSLSPGGRICVTCKARRVAPSARDVTGSPSRRRADLRAVRRARLDYDCRCCGAAGFLLSYGRCAGCVLDDRLTELTDGRGNRPGSEQISVLAQALAQAGPTAAAVMA